MKYFIAIKPKGEFYTWLKLISGCIKNTNPGSVPVLEEELLHVTLHKPVEGDYKDFLLEVIEIILASKYSKTRVVLTGLGIFKNKLVIRVQPTYSLAEMWSATRIAVSACNKDFESNSDDMLHVTLFENADTLKPVTLAEIARYFPLEGKEFPIEYVCLFEKKDQGKWQEIQRTSLAS